MLSHHGIGVEPVAVQTQGLFNYIAHTALASGVDGNVVGNLFYFLACADDIAPVREKVCEESSSGASDSPQGGEQNANLFKLPLSSQKRLQ